MTVVPFQEEFDEESRIALPPRRPHRPGRPPAGRRVMPHRHAARPRQDDDPHHRKYNYVLNC